MTPIKLVDTLEEMSCISVKSPLHAYYLRREKGAQFNRSASVVPIVPRPHRSSAERQLTTLPYES